MNTRKRGSGNIDQQAVIDELNHRLKNVLTIMGALVAQSEHNAEDVEGFAADLRARIAAFATSHDQLNRKGFDAAPLRELVEIKMQPFALHERLVLDGPDVHLAAIAYTATSMALHEMTTNAVKYGALSVPEGQLALRWSRHDDGALEIVWQEADGPAVANPKQVGHGSQMLEKVIAGDLQGKIEVEYAKRGFRARLVIPAGYVSDGAPQPVGAAVASADADETREVELPKGFSVLVVEDNPVIALDIADIVTQLGAKRVKTADDVEKARALLSKMKPDFVLLDVNLGEETSIEFAGELARAGKKFAFVTGADGVAALPGELEQRPLLQKPYSDASIHAVLSELSLQA